MTALWPSNFPQYVTRRGYSEKPKWPKREFKPAEGEPIQTPLTTVRLMEVACTMIMKSEQISALYDFVWKTLEKGTLSFLGPHPRTREQVEIWLIGNPDPFSIQVRTGLEYNVTFKLLIKEPI